MSHKGSRVYNKTEMPDCTGWKAFVLPGAFYGDCVGLMAEAGFEKATTVEEADVVVFTGGSDINPELYGQKNKYSSFNNNRDVAEEWWFNKAKSQKKVMFGICRGAQFLHAMNGGQLWQDVNNHAGRDHLIVDIEEDVILPVTSLHHQMLKPNEEIQIIAVCNSQVATSFKDDKQSISIATAGKQTDPMIEIEAGAYTKTACFFVQGHPEIGAPVYRSWTMNKLYDFIVDWEGVQDGELITIDESNRHLPTIN